MINLKDYDLWQWLLNKAHKKNPEGVNRLCIFLKIKDVDNYKKLIKLFKYLDK